MFELEPQFWLILLAIGVFFLTVVVVLASSLMPEDDEVPRAARSRDDAGIA
jgi:hypothetical protein